MPPKKLSRQGAAMGSRSSIYTCTPSLSRRMVSEVARRISLAGVTLPRISTAASAAHQPRWRLNRVRRKASSTSRYSITKAGIDTLMQKSTLPPTLNSGIASRLAAVM